MLYLEAPHYHNPSEIKINTDISIFLGGSITGADDWQKSAVGKLINYFNVFNPRRNNFVMSPETEREQITWEFNYLKKASIILFYFDFATLAPITLLEYGKFLGQRKYNSWQKIYVSIHPEYKRKSDVLIQTELEYPEILKNIGFNLNETIDKIIKENT